MRYLLPFQRSGRCSGECHDLGYHHNDLRQLGEAGIDRLLHKPFAIDELLRAVNECLGGDARPPAAP